MGPHCINSYFVEVENFDAIDGKKFEIDAARLVYYFDGCTTPIRSISSWC